MYPKRFLTTEEDFEDHCPCAFKIYSFVDAIKDTDVRWFFNDCWHHDDGRYTAIFKSYITDEYKDYLLSIEATPADGHEWNLRIVKKVDNLLGGTGSA